MFEVLEEYLGLKLRDHEKRYDVSREIQLGFKRASSRRSK